MGTFKLKWLIGQLTSIKQVRVNFTTLKNPMDFYLGAIIKLFPFFEKVIITLKFKDGYRIKIYDFMSFYIYAEIFIDKCYDVQLAKEDPLIIDVGANTGFFALRMKQLYPKSKILCFEPYPPCINHLNETIIINQLKDVEIKPLAISDKSGKCKLFIHPTIIGGHSLFSENASNIYVEIESVSLLDVLENIRDHSKCDLLKLDCEGAEFSIIKSINMNSSKYFEHIIYEPTYNSYDIKDLHNHLKKLAYNVETQHSLYHAYKSTNSSSVN